MDKAWMETVVYLLRTAWAEAGVVMRLFFGVVTVLSGAAAFGTALFGWPPTDKLPASISFSVAVVAVFLFLLWHITKRAQKLDDEKIPKITISDPKDYPMPWAPAQEGHRVTRHYYITIANESMGTIDQCAVKEGRFENNRGHVAPVKGRYFRHKSERGANEKTHTYAREIDLNGKGDSIDIDICSMNEGEPNSEIRMYYATTPTQQYPRLIKRDLFPHFLTINVTAKNVPELISKKFRIYVSSDGSLKMETVNGARKVSES